MSISERLKSKKGIMTVLAVIAGIVYVVFGFEIDPALQETATDAISGIVSE